MKRNFLFFFSVESISYFFFHFKPPPVTTFFTMVTPKGKGKGRAVTTPTRRSRRLSGTSPPKSAKGFSAETKAPGKMLVCVIHTGYVEEYFVEHPLLAGLVGKQRPHAMFLTNDMVANMKKFVPESKYTTYTKYTEDEALYRYTSN